MLLIGSSTVQAKKAHDLKSRDIVFDANQAAERRESRMHPFRSKVGGEFIALDQVYRNLDENRIDALRYQE